MRLVIGARSEEGETTAPVTDATPPRRCLTDVLTLFEGRLGDSIAINGCCLTVVGVDMATLSFDAGPETLSGPTWENWCPEAGSILKRRWSG